MKVSSRGTYILTSDRAKGNTTLQDVYMMADRDDDDDSDIGDQTLENTDRRPNSPLYKG
jgi:hypothetical protein